MGKWQGEGKGALAAEGALRVKGSCRTLRMWKESDKGVVLTSKYGSAERHLTTQRKSLVVLKHLFSAQGKNPSAFTSLPTPG